MTVLWALAVLVSAPAKAFCGFYVSGAEGSLYANATRVALLRDGRRTVLSMQNDYSGPPEDFAMVVPVPEVVREDRVRTLPRAIFDRLDTLAAPRLVAYWEQDPCPGPDGVSGGAGHVLTREFLQRIPRGRSYQTGVRVEAEFSVAEYDVVVLSARDSGGLDRWLRAHDYRIPRGAEAVLRPYVAAGTKFFVAKVDPAKVVFEDGRAVLSPLRVSYDSDELALPIRLGLLSSAGEQDLLVHVLGRQRYEVANHPNVRVPTNEFVDAGEGFSFGGYYDAVFERARAGVRPAVVTEYSWSAASCDPCPTPPLTHQELLTLGADVIGGRSNDWVLTRLHHRYTAEDLGEDLVFRAAPPIVGGRGTPDAEGRLADEVVAGSANAFQARYVQLHRWEGEIACENPSRGRWGAPTPPVTPPSRIETGVASAVEDSGIDGPGRGCSSVPVGALWLALVPPLLLRRRGAA